MGRWSAWIWVAAIALSTGCAARREEAAAPRSVEGDVVADPELDAAVRELELRKAELARLRTTRDCPETCRLSSLICAAGERICVIAARHPGEPPYEARCQAARLDCKAATAECGECR